MAETTQPLDLPTQEALPQLADIVTPAPVSWMPQTWGWAVIALLIAAGLGYWIWHAVRRYKANRYRREALAELDALEEKLPTTATRAESLTGMAQLLKRVALAAWPRQDVAALSGAAWVAFLRAHADEKTIPDVAAQLLNDLEYRSDLGSLCMEDSKLVARAVRNWIRGHHVSP